MSVATYFESDLESLIVVPNDMYVRSFLTSVELNLFLAPNQTQTTHTYSVRNASKQMKGEI